MTKRATLVRALIAGACVAILGAGVAAAAPAIRRAGPRPDGTAVIPVGYRVTPAGGQSNLDDLPLTVTPFPDGRAVLIVNAGQGVQSLQVVDPGDGAVLQTIRYTSPEALFVGVAFSPDGRTAYVSAGGNNKIRTYAVEHDRLTETAAIPLPRKNPAGETVNLYPAQIAVTPDGGRLVVADRLADAATVVDLATGSTQTVAVEHAPYGVVITPDGATAYVSNQGGTTVSVLDLTVSPPVVRASVAVGVHPNQVVLDGAHHLLYVANGDSDSISVIDTRAHAVTRTVGLAPYPGAPVGSNPDGLALSADGTILYVANSGNNDVAEDEPDMVARIEERRANTPKGAAKRAALVSAMELRHYEFNAHGVELGQFYESDAVVSDGSRRPQPSRDPELFYEPSTVPGSRLPHVWVGDVRNKVSALDLAPMTRFTLLTGIAGEPRAAAAEKVGHQLGVPLATVVIGHGREVTDLYYDWARLREVDEDGALLVRPDKHIGWRSMRLPADPERALYDAIATILGREVVA